MSGLFERCSTNWSRLSNKLRQLIQVRMWRSPSIPSIEFKLVLLSDRWKPCPEKLKPGFINFPRKKNKFLPKKFIFRTGCVALNWLANSVDMKWEHLLHMTSPHSRQWWRRRVSIKRLSHPKQEDTSLSDFQGTIDFSTAEKWRSMKNQGCFYLVSSIKPFVFFSFSHLQRSTLRILRSKTIVGGFWWIWGISWKQWNLVGCTKFLKQSVLKINIRMWLKFSLESGKIHVVTFSFSSIKRHVDAQKLVESDKNFVGFDDTSVNFGSSILLERMSVRPSLT